MRPLDIQASYQQMIERGLCGRTVRYTHVVLKSAMRQALQWCLLLENPADGVKIPQQSRGEMRSFTVEQARTFLKTALATPHGPVLAAALTTGMRPSEYLGLMWQDIDWTRQTVSGVRSLRRFDGRWCFCDTKRSRSRRPIKLQRWIVALLRDLHTKASAHNLFPAAEDLVFKTASGSQSMPIICASISDRYSTLPVCHESGSTICATRRRQVRWQPGCLQKLSPSSSDMPARPSR